MKIHIVQKGDTLWDISKKYGVNFEELKKANSQLSSPDMIMPGMKIKVPGETKQIKKETVVAKEVKKEIKKEAVKAQPIQTPKPLPVVQEDETAFIADITFEMPKMPQMPIIEKEVKNYTMIQFPEYKPPVKEKKKEEKKVVKEEVAEKEFVAPEAYYAPVQEECYQPHPHMYCYYVHPCFPWYPAAAPFHHHPHHMYGMAPVNYPAEYMMPLQQQAGDCGCGARSRDPEQEWTKDNNQLFTQPYSAFAGQMYPPQANYADINGNTYPAPPAFPTFSALHHDTDNKEEQNE